CDRGNIWPSQNAHPFGAKLKGKMRISATNGSIGIPQVGDGKMPNSEMMKSRQRYGWKLSCGWLPPVGLIADGLRFASVTSAVKSVTDGEDAGTKFAGEFCVPGVVEATSVWVCDGIWFTVSVIDSAPPVSARMKPLPWWSGTRPRRSGSANVDCPSPPYVVPIRLNNVSYSEIGSNCPSQNIQPAGAKFPANIRISPT